jgi:hypothetical protein
MSSSQQDKELPSENNPSSSVGSLSSNNPREKLADDVLIKETTRTTSSTGSDEKETGSTKSSSDGFVAPQNVMEAVEMEGLTFKSTSSSGASGENRAEGEIDIKEKETKTSPSLQTWTNQLKELNQASPRNVKSPLKRFSQDSIERSPARSSRHAASPANRRRSKNLQGFHRIDEWLIKSPEKSSQESEVSRGSDDSSQHHQSEEVVVVEETQSPKTTKVSSYSLPIQETPPPPTHKEAVKFGNTRGSTRKLFTKGTDAPSVDDCEDSNIIPGSPESTSSSLFIGVGTPVLKLKRLTDKQIKHFSPQKKDVDTLQEERKHQNGLPEVGLQSASHEHDDFSDVLPLDDVPLSSSQGFKTQDKERESVDQAGDKPMTSTENLFSQIENVSQDNSVYDPQLQSTFKSNCEGKDVLGTENLILSQESDKSGSSEKESQGNEARSEESAPFYDPKAESTLAQERPRRGRKRKQEAPKKLSPESSRPKRTRQGKTDNVKTSKCKVGEGKRGSQKGGNKGKTAEKKEVNGNTSGQKMDEADVSASSVESQEQVEDVTGQTSVSENMDTEKENDLCDERQLDSEGFLLEKTQDKNSKAEPGQKLDELHAASDGLHQRMDESSQNLNEKKKLESLEVVTVEEKGEKTPSNRSSGDVPVRKSTTKKKMEAAKKRSQKKGKDGSDDQVTSDCSEDDMPLAQTAKQTAKSKGKLESKMDAVTIKTESLTDDAKILNDLDDAIPLINLSANEKNREENGERFCRAQTYGEKTIEGWVKQEDTENNEENVSEEKQSGTDGRARKKAKKRPLPAKTSPLSNRLRSSQGTLRSGKLTRRSLSPRLSPKSFSQKKPTRRSLSPRQSPKSLSLKKTVKRKSIDTGMLAVVIEDSEEPEGLHSNDLTGFKTQDDLFQMSKVDMSEETGGDNNKAAQQSKDVTKVNTKDDATEMSRVDLSEEMGGHDGKAADDIEMLAEPKRVTFDETPKKNPDMVSDGGDLVVFDRNTDSKLVVVSRRFEKKGIARRSILKPPSPGSNLGNSPLRAAAPFHPIKLGQIYAPSASPSASILKRRRLSGEVPTNSPSPRGKVSRREFPRLIYVYQILKC